jgi:hypothetical protein
LLAEVDNEDDSDSDSAPVYDGDDDGGFADNTEDYLEEVLKGDALQENVPQPELVLEEVPQEEEPH